MKSPCKGCEYRVIGCHSTCAAYIKYSCSRKEELETRDIRGDVIYSRKTADAALAALGLRKEIKRKPVYPEIEASALVTLREKGLSVRQIAGKYGVSYTFVRNRLLAAGVNLERIKKDK